MSFVSSFVFAFLVFPLLPLLFIFLFSPPSSVSASSAFLLSLPSSLLLPFFSPQARRIEHRVAGGDICPYLMLAAVLGSTLIGIEDATQPPEPLTGNAYDADLPQIPTSRDEAIETFAASAIVRRIFPDMLVENLVMTKRQEARIMANTSAGDRLRIYLERV